MFIRHLLPVRHRAAFVVTYVLARILLVIVEHRVFAGPAPILVVIGLSIAVAVVLVQVGKALGWYDEEPEAVIEPVTTMLPPALFAPLEPTPLVMPAPSPMQSPPVPTQVSHSLIRSGQSFPRWNAPQNPFGAS